MKRELEDLPLGIEDLDNPSDIEEACRTHVQNRIDEWQELNGLSAGHTQIVGSFKTGEAKPPESDIDVVVHLCIYNVEEFETSLRELNHNPESLSKALRRDVTTTCSHIRSLIDYPVPSVDIIPVEPSPALIPTNS